MCPRMPKESSQDHPKHARELADVKKTKGKTSMSLIDNNTCPHSMDNALLDKDIYSGCMTQANSSSRRTWFHRVTKSLSEIELQQLSQSCALLVQDVQHTSC